MKTSLEPTLVTPSIYAYRMLLRSRFRAGGLGREWLKKGYVREANFFMPTMPNDTCSMFNAQ